MKKELNVEDGYNIALIFLSELWPLIEPKLQGFEELKIVNRLFFHSVCGGDEASKEWKQAVYRALKILKEKLREAKLTEEEIFSCAFEFCKLHNERWEGELEVTLGLLQSMKTEPEKHSDAWAIWKKAKDAVLVDKMRCAKFEW